MFYNAVKRMAASLPQSWQLEMKRWHYRRLLLSGRFLPNEPEYDLLPSLIHPGACVLDIGANIGHYTAIFSKLAGQQGRVFVFEPIPRTFLLLTANSRYFAFQNVTFLNVAASDSFGAGHMIVPQLNTGLDNYYMAYLKNGVVENGIEVFRVPIDALQFPKQVSLVKVDAEGHDRIVLAGMRGLLERDHPVVFVEDRTKEVTDYMQAMGFDSFRLPKSPNQIFVYHDSPYRELIKQQAISKA